MLSFHLTGFKEQASVIIVVIQDYFLLILICNKIFIDPSVCLPFPALCPSHPGSNKPVRTATFFEHLTACLLYTSSRLKDFPGRRIAPNKSACSASSFLKDVYKRQYYGRVKEYLSTLPENEEM